MFQNLSTQAQIIGSNTASALLFNDQQSAENTLAALRASPEILSAAFTPRMAGLSQHIPAIKRDRSTRFLPFLRDKQNPLAQEQGDRAGPLDRVSAKADRGCLHPIGVEELRRRQVRYAGIAASVLLASLLQLCWFRPSSRSRR